MIEIKKQTFKNYKYIDLFCGIGGFHLALDSLGAECVFASDIDSNARLVYEKNFGIKPSGDITKIENNSIPNHDILCAGFPCQPFSISGNQKGFDDPRGKLFFEIIRIAKYHNPKIIFLENVKNFTTHNNGSTLQKVKDELKKIGYNVFDKVLISSNYGIPQARKRLYIIALKETLKIQKFSFPGGTPTLQTVKNILCDESSRYNVYVNRSYMMDTKPIKRNGLIHIAKIGKGRQGERIYSIDGYATTLSSQGGGLGGKTGMYLVDNKIRKLYPRECARLMGFPDSFEYAKDKNTAYKQFGNSVVVDVLQSILLELGKILTNEKEH